MPRGVSKKAVALKPVRAFIFRAVPQITLNYRGMPLSADSAGRIHGGDRVPWVPGSGDDYYTSLSAMFWQVHVSGKARDDLVGWCADHGIPLHVFEWKPEHDAADLAQNALYLIRPGTYVALAEASGDPRSIDHYFVDRHIRLSRSMLT